MDSDDEFVMGTHVASEETLPSSPGSAAGEAGRQEEILGPGSASGADGPGLESTDCDHDRDDGEGVGGAAGAAANVPLAELIRPRTLAQYIGQRHLLGGVLANYVRLGRLPSMVLHGPPGVGKTSLVALLARAAGYRLVELLATTATVDDLRRVLSEARGAHPPVAVFIDEVHRLTRTQQDFLLPYIELGLFSFVGATTADPRMRIRRAILLRCHLFELHPLLAAEMHRVVQRAVLHENVRRRVARGLRFMRLSGAAAAVLVRRSGGDVRAAVNLVELVSASLSIATADTVYRRGDHAPVAVSEAHVRRIVKASPSLRLQHRHNLPLVVGWLRAMYHAPGVAPRPRSALEERVDASDDEKPNVEPGVYGARALFYMNCLLERGELAIFLARHLLLFTCLYPSSRQVSLVEAVAVWKTVTSSSADARRVLADFTERAACALKRPIRSPASDPVKRLRAVKRFCRGNLPVGPGSELDWPAVTAPSPDSGRSELDSEPDSLAAPAFPVEYTAHVQHLM